MSVVAEKPKKQASAKTAQVESKPILGVDLKGELQDIELSRIVDPKGTADRIEREGDQDKIDQLAETMREVGQLQPVMVEQLVDGRYCRVFGRRRIAAARQNKWYSIRAIVVPPLPDDVRRTIVAIENVQRQDLTPAEETLAVDELMQLQAPSAAVQFNKPLLDICGIFANRMLTTEDREKISRMGPEHQAAARHDILLDHRVRNVAAELVAAMLGKPATWVRDRLYIGRLSEKSKKLVLDGLLPLAHAREIAKLADPVQRDRLAKDFAAGGSDSIGDTEAGPLEDLQDEVRKTVFSLHVVPWKLDQEVGDKRACAGCPHNSLSNPGLFEHGGEVSTKMVAGRGSNWESAEADSAKVQESGVCSLPSCYAEKLRTAKAAISAATKRIVDGGKKPSEAKVPSFVDTNALNKKVNERRDSSGRRTHSASSRSSGQKIDWEAKYAAERLAEQEYDKLVEKKLGPVFEPLQRHFAANKSKLLVYELLMTLTPIRDCSHYQASAVEKSLVKPGVDETLKILLLPVDKAMEEIAKRRFGNTGVGKDMLDLERIEARYTIAGKIAKLFELPVAVETLPKRSTWQAARVKELLSPKKPEKKPEAAAPVKKKPSKAIPARKSSTNRKSVEAMDDEGDMDD